MKLTTSPIFSSNQQEHGSQLRLDIVIIQVGSPSFSNNNDILGWQISFVESEKFP
jgi:hypothetical protein